MNMREPCIYLVYADPRDENSDLVESAGYVRLFCGHPEFGSHFKALVEDAVTGELSSEDIDIVTMLGLGEQSYDRPPVRASDGLNRARHRWHVAYDKATLRQQKLAEHRRLQKLAERQLADALTTATKTEGDDHGE